MDYKEKFEEFLDKMQGLLDNARKRGHIIVRVEDLENAFPELKESEDEMIRKELIDTINLAYDCGIAITIEYRDKYLAWLEKQGEKPVELSKEEYRKAYYDGWNNCNLQHSQRLSDSNDVVKCLINGMKFYYEGNEEATWGTEKFPMKVKDILAWLEKQVPIDEERKYVALSIMNFLDRNTLGMGLSSMECADLEDAVMSSDWSKVYDYMKKKLEKKGGQKPNYCHHEVDLSNCSEEYMKAYYDGWNNCNLQWQHWLDDNHINVGERFDYQHATIVNKDFAENPWETKPTHECNCKYAGCCVNGVRRWCHFIENEIPYDRCNPDCHSYQKFSVGDRIFESGKDTISTIVGMERDKEGTGWYLFADGDKIRFDVAHQHYKLVVDVESEKVTFKRSTVTVEEPLPFEQENNNVFLYGLHGGQPQDEKKELGAITTVRGEDYVCVKDYKVGDCSYTKGKIYHSQRDGYLTDDNGISWSCPKSFYQEYLSDVNRHSS